MGRDDIIEAAGRAAKGGPVLGIWVTVLVCIVLTAAGNCLLRYGARGAADLLRSGGGSLAAQLLRTPALWIGLLCYGMGAILWIWVLSRQDLVLTYPVFVGGTFVLVLLVAWRLFGESLNAPRMLGAALILVGILIAILWGQGARQG